ncbi:LLM class flavin-dependent oxidoreductase [Actinokineospora sp. 24-640]
MTDIGVMLPSTSAANAGRYGIAESAVRAEELGFDSVWTVDHLAFHTGIVEPVVALSAAAAVTSRVRLAFGVLLAALRHPALIAKQISSLQALSHDRVVLGIGVGGENPREWTAAGVPVGERGARTDAFLDALPRLVSGQPGRLPKPWDVEVPALCPHGSVPPVWVGGRGAAAMARTVRHGEGWLGLFVHPDGVVRRRAQLAGLAMRLERPMPRAGVMVFANADDSDPESARREATGFLRAQYGLAPEQAARHVVAGTEDEVAAGLRAFADAGADRLVLFPAAADYPAQYERLARCAAGLGRAPHPKPGLDAGEDRRAHRSDRPRLARALAGDHQPADQRVDGRDRGLGVGAHRHP